MPRPKRPRPTAEIETGSFSDISFLLIIFFVLTTTFTKTTGRQVDLPSAAPPEKAKTDSQQKLPSVNILPDRILYSQTGEDPAETTLPALKTSLDKLHRPQRPENERLVLVEVGDEVPYERYFQVVTLVAASGGVVALQTEDR